VAALIPILAGLALVPTGADAAPKRPNPTVAAITAQLDKLAGRAEALTEQYNAGRIEVAHRQQVVKAARARQAAAEKAFAAARKRLIPMLVAQYESDGFQSVGAMLTSADPTDYLDSLSAQELVTRHWADVVQQVKHARAVAENARTAADEQLGAATEAQDALAGKRQQVRDQIAKYHRLLAALTARQQAAYANQGTPTADEIAAAIATPAPTKAAARAVQFAEAQVGKPYVFGATGPNAWDCSGLTMAAWAKGGVSLPHFAAAQYTYGRHVGFDSLLPGDLIFLYSDIHHVEIYVGAGLAISAPQEGEPVKYVRVAYHRDVFYGATRLS
jgi:cell wall-associated NlpC family hydrolase